MRWLPSWASLASDPPKRATDHSRHIVGAGAYDLPWTEAVWTCFIYILWSSAPLKVLLSQKNGVAFSQTEQEPVFCIILWYFHKKCPKEKSTIVLLHQHVSYDAHHPTTPHCRQNNRHLTCLYLRGKKNNILGLWVPVNASEPYPH